MNLGDMEYTHLFLGTLLVPLLGLDGAHGPCPTPCRCSLEILNCSRVTNPPGFKQVPLPKPDVHPHPFTYLDFTGNAISSIGEEVWKAYPWSEYLVLKENSLSRLQNSSLEGLFSLTYLDVSCNKIQTVERNAFEAVPFLEIINLSGNRIERITEGTFQAWHGMQFLLKVDLSHNPLMLIQDSSFYRLPSLKLLDLGATKVTLRVLVDLLQSSLKLRTLILPKKMSCCLCHIKEFIEVLCESVKLECTESCDLCEKEEPLNRMQEEVMKALEIRKLRGSSLLTILPERAVPSNTVLERTKPNDDTLVLAQNYSSLATNFNLLKSVKRLVQVKAGKLLGVNWADKDELKKLYLLASLLRVALKESIVELEKDSLGAVQNELSAKISKKSTDGATKSSTDASLRKERHVRKVKRENWIVGNQRQKDKLFRLGRDGQPVTVITTQSADKPSVFALHNEAESWRKVAESLDPQRDLPFHRSRQVALQSSWKRSISDSLTNTLKPTSSIIVDKNDNDLTSISSDGKSIAELENGFGAPVLTKEELLNQLLHRINPPAGDGKSKISASDLEPSLNELLPDIMLTHGTSWEHQNSAPPDEYLLQGDHFEAELNKQLTSLIPNAPVRKLISHVIRILKMDCTAPTLQMACAKLISRTGLLMKLFSENINETSSLWKSYFWPSKNLANKTTASSRKLEEPLGKIASQGIAAYGYGNKLLWAVSVTAVIMLIISMICLIEVCSQRSAAKEKTFLGRRKKPLPDEELPRTASLLVDKPFWLKDMYQSQDEIQKKTMADKLHDEESSEEVDIVSWGNARPSLPEPSLENSSSKTLSIPAYEMPTATTAAPPPPPPRPPPPPPPPPASAPQPSSMKKSPDTLVGTSEAPSSSAAAAEEAEEEEVEEGSDEKSESPTTEATSEAPESGEVEGEEEEEEESD